MGVGVPHAASRGGVVADEKFAESNLLGKSYCAISDGDMHGHWQTWLATWRPGICTIFLTFFAEARVST